MKVTVTQEYIKAGLSEKMRELCLLIGDAAHLDFDSGLGGNIVRIGGFLASRAVCCTSDDKFILLEMCNVWENPVTKNIKISYRDTIGTVSPQDAFDFLSGKWNPYEGTVLQRYLTAS